MVDLGSLKSYRSRVGRRGPKGPDLKLRIGNKPGQSIRAKIPGMDVGDVVRGKVREAWVEDFEGRGAVIYGGGEQTMLVLEPSAEENHVEFGPFFVTGRFVVVTTLTDAAVAAEIWATYRRATQLHLVDTENGAGYWVSANGQRAAMELAREAGGRPTGVVPTFKIGARGLPGQQLHIQAATEVTAWRREYREQRAARLEDKFS